MTAAERFFSMVEKIPFHSCWEWTGSLTRGYGQFGTGGKAHRFSYELHKGPIPDGLAVTHLCHNPTCVNPDHLEAVSHREALRRGVRAIRWQSGVCARGHDLSVFGKFRGDTRNRGSVFRRCMECGRQDARRYRVEHLEEILTKQRERSRLPENRTRNHELTRLWNLAHRDRKAANENRRRARKAGNGGSHTFEEWLEKCDLLGNVCFYCGESKPLSEDHKVPISRGGTDDISNILPACLLCNQRKNRRTAQEYIAYRLAG